MRQERRILSGTEENPITEVTTTWNDDGTRVECYENHETSEGIIRELDAQGNLIRETFGRFYEPPEISDEELDEFIRKLVEKSDEKFDKFRRKLSEKPDEEFDESWRKLSGIPDEELDESMGELLGRNG